jgi:uncharacterized membrane protein
VFVSGATVCVAGYERSIQGNMVAMLWKDGEARRLSHGSGDAWAESVYVSGDDVYVAGRETTVMGHSTAVVWKNGEATALNGEETDAAAESIFVVGRSVYVAGRESAVGLATGWSDNWHATLWKDGAATHLSEGGGNAGAYSVSVSDGDVYVAGYESRGDTFTAALWKDGEALHLSEGDFGTEATSVFVSFDDVYVVGHFCEFAKEGRYTTFVRKNGVARRLGGKHLSAYANSVFVRRD